MANFGWSLPAGCNTLPGEEMEYCPNCGKSEMQMDEENFIENENGVFCDQNCFDLAQDDEKRETYLKAINEEEHATQIAFMRELEDEVNQ